MRARAEREGKEGRGGEGREMIDEGREGLPQRGGGGEGGEERGEKEEGEGMGNGMYIRNRRDESEEMEGAKKQRVFTTLHGEIQENSYKMLRFKFYVSEGVEQISGTTVLQNGGSGKEELLPPAEPNCSLSNSERRVLNELEAERDAALQRIAVLEAEAASQAKSLEDAMQRMKDQTALLEKMNEESALISMEKEKLAEELEGLQTRIDETEITKREALEQADGAREAAHAFSLKMAELEAKYFEAQTALEASVNEGLQKESVLKEELEETKALLASAEREKNALKSTVVEGSSKAAEELASLRAKAAELEGKLGASESRLARMAAESANARGGDGASSNRSRGFSSGRSQTTNALESLGLDAVREERLLWKSSKGQAGDLEGGTEPLLDHHRMRRLTKRGTSASSDGEGKESSVMDWIMRGRSKELFGFDEMRGTEPHIEVHKFHRLHNVQLSTVSQ
ncbi:hypothetical protein CBR_g31871 [Chara braunii]|uniref:Uncharacterized protein n=1 Tax=Chara braunii TaxID=69332 RepID=A0A388LFW7_CHABU|nr:hypothetical protein CBR_g31871 [Chara braunii]|eukprot:GBG81198.1 hypothetical protein CBR_g31871 [Chara braunii]